MYLILIDLDCGRAPFSNDELIDKDGEKLLLGNNFWMVRILERNDVGFYNRTYTNAVICGGSIIALNVVISGKIFVQCI